MGEGAPEEESGLAGGGGVFLSSSISGRLDQCSRLP